MSIKPDWRTVNELPMTHDRKRNDEPPTTEEILAYSRGKLSAEAEEQMRERLMDYPDILRALAVPFPNEPAQPGDPDYVSDEEWPQHWAALQKRMDRGRVVEFRRHAWTALAAIVAIVFVGLYWQAERKLGQPGVVEEIVLNTETRRGPGGPPQPIHVSGDSVLLRAPLAVQPNTEYRLAFFDESGTRELWSSDALRPEGDLRVLVRRQFLSPGLYQIRVYANEERLDEYIVQVYPR
ncbi:MAG TPA: hypothetical protein VGD79_09410 [Thermoanaerobaculia bacterium]|jgi:hypothetical protein